MRRWCRAACWRSGGQWQQGIQAHSLRQKPYGDVFVPVLRAQQVHGLAMVVDGPIQIPPRALQVSRREYAQGWHLCCMACSGPHRWSWRLTYAALCVGCASRAMVWDIVPGRVIPHDRTVEMHDQPWERLLVADGPIASHFRPRRHRCSARTVQSCGNDARCGGRLRAENGRDALY